MTPRIGISAAILAIGFCASVAACSIQVRADDDYNGEIFRPSPALADWFEHLERRNPPPGEPVSCCDAGDAYPIVILQEATIDGSELDGIAEVTATNARKVVTPAGHIKWRPEWTGPRRFKFAGKHITRELDGNPTKTAWVFARIEYGYLSFIYCVVPLPPAF